jgi:hypothetical protein
VGLILFKSKILSGGMNTTFFDVFFGRIIIYPSVAPAKEPFVFCVEEPLLNFIKNPVAVLYSYSNPLLPALIT